MARIRPKKSLGQHFLKDQNIIENIVESLPADREDLILEIGPGTGNLTAVLLSHFDHLSVVELDRRAISLLQKQFPNLKILHEDILKVDLEQLLDAERGKVHVVGNLPYFITSQILFKILESRYLFESATFMMQKEVAARLIAQPGTKEYGILSVQIQLMSTPKILFDVPPQAFTPPPKVVSSMVRLDFDRRPLMCSDQNLKKVVRTAFQQRRKKLSNALKSIEPLPTDPEFDYDKRAEAWEPEMYEKLTARLEQDGTMS